MIKAKFVLFVFSFALLQGVTPYKRHYLSLITQNDAYVNPMIDRYYTAGHSLLYASSEGDYGGLNSFGFIQSNATSFSLELSQSIYSPKAKFAFYPPFDDHRYAGFLNLGFFIHHRSDSMLESLGIKIGVSGKISYAQEAQNGIHKLLGVGLLNGWHTQIANEGIINAYYEWTYRHFLFNHPYFGIDLLPNLEFAFGNANIYAKFNLFLRLGYNLSSTFLPQGVVGENGGLQTGRAYADGIGFFAFLGLGGGAVMRNMFIEGNFFGRDVYPHKVSLSPFIGNLSAGFSLVSGALSLSYKIVMTSPEFQEQKEAHTIGSIAISYSF